MTTVSTEMKIKSIFLNEFCEYGTTVTVECENYKGLTVNFHVQTVDDEHRSDLGCWLFTDEDSEDIDADDYPLFNVSEVVGEAEKFLADKFEIERVKAGIYTKEDKETGECEVLVKNSSFINSLTSSYQRKWEHSHGIFESKVEALEFIAKL